MKYTSGFTLVELLIALLLGAFLSVGVITVFTGTKETFLVQGGLSNIQQGGRFSVDMISPYIRMAGYTGCYSKNIPIKNTLNGSPSVAYDMSTPLEGYDASGSNWKNDTTTLTLAQLQNALGVSSSVAIKDGTDVLVLRQAGNNGLKLAAAMPNVSAAIKVESNLSPAPIANGDILYISDCQKSAIFQVTNYTNSSGNIVHNTGASSFSPGNSTKQLSDSGAYDTDAYVFKIETRVFFIAEGNTNNNGDVYHSLWMKSGVDNPVELVPGIEDFQVSYGEDRNSDGVPDVYASADQITDMANVMSVRLSVQATSINAVGDTGDGILSQNFSSIVKLRNRGL